MELSTSPNDICQGYMNLLSERNQTERSQFMEVIQDYMKLLKEFREC